MGTKLPGDTINDPARPMVAWLILVYDRTAVERFPFKRKWYRLVYSQASPEEVEKVLQIFGRKTEIDTPLVPDLGVGETRISFQIGGSRFTSSEILAYRHLFELVPNESDLLPKDQPPAGFHFVTLPHDSYFEDENEKPITLLQVFDEEGERRTGAKGNAVVFDMPSSILRFGPAEPIRAELWKSTDAELVYHLFDIYQQLVKSRWLRSRCVVSPMPNSSVQAVLPLHQDCMSVVLPFRQLYSKDSADDLFNKVCKIHNRHCTGNSTALDWIKYYQRQFNSNLDDIVGFPLQNCTLPARRYLDAFAYGARLVHVTGNSDTPAQDLSHLLTSYPREMVVMGYHATLRQLLQTVSMAIPVLKQNLLHWIKELKWESSTTLGGKALLEP